MIPITMEEVIRAFSAIVSVAILGAIAKNYVATERLSGIPEQIAKIDRRFEKIEQHFERYADMVQSHEGELPLLRAQVDVLWRAQLGPGSG